MENFKNVHCMNCRSSNLQRFIDLGAQPNGNHFPLPGSTEKEPMFPFAMTVCTDCWQVQLEEFPSPEFMFRDHPYITGLNKPIVAHFEKLSRHIVEMFKIPANSLVIDIGANDGTFLGKFRDLGMRVLGVDPGAITGALAREQGVTVCETFWNQNTGRAIKDLNLQPRLITATAVFYHVPDIHDFVLGLREVMTEETIFMTQCVYLKDLLEKNQFDHFYHEHTLIHALAPLKRLFDRYGMRMIDVEFDPVHGGSFILYVGLNSSVHATTPRVSAALAEEEKARLDDLRTYADFKARVERNRVELVALLRQLKAEGKSVYGLCAPLKGSTLLNYAKIGPELIECMTEVNPHKIGRVTPGTHIPIIDEARVKAPPDYYLVMSWNFLDYFLGKYRDYLEAGGHFIVPNPDVKVIGKKDLTPAV
jgi:SAM-dependent methyltransferase